MYNTFVVEERHGFNKQTAAFYAKDQVKKFLVGQAIQAPILAGIIKVINPYLYKKISYRYLLGYPEQYGLNRKNRANKINLLSDTTSACS